MRITPIIALWLLTLSLAMVARADDVAPNENPASHDAGPKLGEAHTQKWKFGMIVAATGGAVAHVNCSAAVPIPWPEQSLKFGDRDLSPGVTVKYNSYGTAKQMFANFSRIP